MGNVSKRVQKEYFRTEKLYFGYNNQAVNKRFVDLIDGIAGDIISDFVEDGNQLTALLKDLEDMGSEAAGVFMGHYWQGVEAAAKASAKEHGF